MTRVLSFTLPVPPSANAYWRIVAPRSGKRPFLVKTAEATAWQQTAKVLARQQGAHPLTGEVKVTVHWYRARKAGDTDNRAKILGDALEGICYANDSQVAELRIVRHDTERDNSRLDVVVQPVEAGPISRALDF